MEQTEASAIAGSEGGETDSSPETQTGESLTEVEVAREADSEVEETTGPLFLLLAALRTEHLITFAMRKPTLPPLRRLLNPKPFRKSPLLTLNPPLCRPLW